MVLDYNKLLVKRSNIVVYSSLQSPHPRRSRQNSGVSACLCVCLSIT